MAHWQQQQAQATQQPWGEPADANGGWGTQPAQPATNGGWEQPQQSGGWEQPHQGGGYGQPAYGQPAYGQQAPQAAYGQQTAYGVDAGGGGAAGWGSQLPPDPRAAYGQPQAQPVPPSGGGSYGAPHLNAAAMQGMQGVAANIAMNYGEEMAGKLQSNVRRQLRARSRSARRSRAQVARSALAARAALASASLSTFGLRLSAQIKQSCPDQWLCSAAVLCWVRR